jgi:hypothetical protein
METPSLLERIRTRLATWLYHRLAPNPPNDTTDCADPIMASAWNAHNNINWFLLTLHEIHLPASYTLALQKFILRIIRDTPLNKQVLNRRYYKGRLHPENPEYKYTFWDLITPDGQDVIQAAEHYINGRISFEEWSNERNKFISDTILTCPIPGDFPNLVPGNGNVGNDDDNIYTNAAVHAAVRIIGATDQNNLIDNVECTLSYILTDVYADPAYASLARTITTFHIKAFKEMIPNPFNPDTNETSQLSSNT